MEQNILEMKKNLSDHELSVFNSEMEKYKKSTGLAYLLWFFLGTLGIHKFYIGKIKFGIVYLIIGLAAWIFLIIGITAGVKGIMSEANAPQVIGTGIVLFIICIVIVGILLLIDLFTMPKQIKQTYEKNEIMVLKKMKSI